MAQELDDGEFWLPSEFLTDDDLLMDFKTDYSKTKGSNDFSLGIGNAFGFNSDLSSPVESVLSSTETESDEDDFISGLTRDVEGLKLSGSPQSTLCGFKPGSNPNSASRIPNTPGSENAIGWDLLYAAAGEVARMRMTEETSPFCSTKSYPPIPAAAKNPSPPSSYYPNQAQTAAHLAFIQLQATHYERMNQQHQLMQNRAWGPGKMEYHHFQNNGGKINGELGRTEGLSMASWPTLQQSQSQQQQQPGSAMRTVFLGDTGSKKERTGTGVFLPRRIDTTLADNRKKTGFSTALVPDPVGHESNRMNNGVWTQQRRSQISPPAMSQELGLPQDWTY